MSVWVTHCSLPAHPPPPPPSSGLREARDVSSDSPGGRGLLGGGPGGWSLSCRPSRSIPGRRPPGWTLPAAPGVAGSRAHRPSPPLPPASQAFPSLRSPVRVRVCVLGFRDAAARTPDHPTSWPRVFGEGSRTWGAPHDGHCHPYSPPPTPHTFPPFLRGSSRGSGFRRRFRSAGPQGRSASLPSAHYSEEETEAPGLPEAGLRLSPAASEPRHSPLRPLIPQPPLQREQRPRSLRGARALPCGPARGAGQLRQRQGAGGRRGGLHGGAQLLAPSSPPAPRGSPPPALLPFVHVSAWSPPRAGAATWRGPCPSPRTRAPPHPPACPPRSSGEGPSRQRPHTAVRPGRPRRCGGFCLQLPTREDGVPPRGSSPQGSSPCPGRSEALPANPGARGRQPRGARAAAWTERDPPQGCPRARRDRFHRREGRPGRWGKAGRGPGVVSRVGAVSGREVWSPEGRRQRSGARPLRREALWGPCAPAGRVRRRVRPASPPSSRPFNRTQRPGGPGPSWCLPGTNTCRGGAPPPSLRVRRSGCRGGLVSGLGSPSLAPSTPRNRGGGGGSVTAGLGLGRDRTSWLQGVPTLRHKRRKEPQTQRRPRRVTVTRMMRPRVQHFYSHILSEVHSF